MSTFTITELSTEVVVTEQVTGLQGAAGTNGTNGVGVPTAGTTGQVLVKTSATNYATGWTSTLANVTSVNGTTIPAASTLITSATTNLPNVTSVNSTTIPAASTLLTPASSLDPTKISSGTAGISISGNAGTVTNGVYTTTTSLPNVTSVNSTTIPASSTLLTPASSLDPTKISSGTAGISISGNAGTVTNGVYTTTTSLPNVTSANGTTIPASSSLVTSANFRAGQLAASGTIDVVPRMQVGSTRAMTAGTVYFTGFSPVADVTVSKITAVVTAVVGTNTLQYGIYSVSGTTVTTIATTAVSGTAATGLVELSFSSAPTLTAGSNYMIGFLAVGGTSVTVAGTAIQNSAALQGNGSSGVLTPLVAGSSSTTSYGSLPSSGNVAISSTVASSFAFARLN